MEELAGITGGIHRRVYGCPPQAMAYAPGRVEILGNHTDYNKGTVLSAAIDMGACFAISAGGASGDGAEPGAGTCAAMLHVYAGNLDDRAEFDLSEIAPVPGHDWAGYVRGVLYYLAEKYRSEKYQSESGRGIEGWNCSFYGTVPLGSGLSSSAALEVSASYAAQSMLGIELDPVETAKMCQAAEHCFVGSMTGLLDQFSSIFGEKHHLIHSDFRDNTVFRVRIPQDIGFLLITPELRHSLANSPYNERRKSCETAAAILEKLTGWGAEAAGDIGRIGGGAGRAAGVGGCAAGVGGRAAGVGGRASASSGFSLREVGLERFRELRARLPDEAGRRAAHIIEEIDRVERGLTFLEDGNIEAFGELMFQSHESSRVNFENSAPELDILVNASREAGALGARLSGGGFGGSIIAMVHENRAADLRAQIDEHCRKEGITAEFNLMIPSEGARRVCCDGGDGCDGGSDGENGDGGEV